MGIDQKVLKKAGVLEGIKSATLEELAECGILIRMKKGQCLFRDKEEVFHIYIVISGMATIYKLNSMGERKVIFTLGKKMMLNEVILNGMPASAGCTMLEDSTILAFPKRRFWLLMEEDSRLMKLVFDSLALKTRRTYRQLKNTTNAMRGDKRLAAKLWKLSHDYGVRTEQGYRIDLDLSITYLADMLGSTRETVSRQVKNLAELGLVVYEKNRFLVPDQDALNRFFKE